MGVTLQRLPFQWNAAVSRFVAEQVTGLALQRLAQSCHCVELARLRRYGLIILDLSDPATMPTWAGRAWLVAMSGRRGHGRGRVVAADCDNDVHGSCAVIGDGLVASR